MENIRGGEGRVMLRYNDWETPEGQEAQRCYQPEWPEELRLRTVSVIDAAVKYAGYEGYQFHCFVQYLFFKQWEALRAYAQEKGISIIGDVPIYVPYDSVDVWADPELFQLDASLIPTDVAGVPPDAFTADGQLWGNPLYRWEEHQKSSSINGTKQCA